MIRQVSMTSRSRKLVFLAILSLVGLMASVQAADYSTWAHHKNIILNTGTDGVSISANVTNFPVLVRLTSSNFTFSEAQPNGEDIRFSKSNTGTDALSYQIESWDATNQTAAIWVKVDTVYTANATQHIVMYWGASTGASTTSLSNAATVFAPANGFAGVWHLGEDPAGTAPQMKDATGNGNDGTSGGDILASQSESGLIGKALHFDGNDDTINCGMGTTLNLTQLSLSVWGYYDSLSVPGYKGIIGRTAAGNEVDYNIDLKPFGEAESLITTPVCVFNEDLFAITQDSSSSWECHDSTIGTVTKKIPGVFRCVPAYIESTPTMPMQSWFLVDYTLDGSTGKLYLNGELVNSTSSTTAPTTLYPFHIGKTWDGAFMGLLDEARIENVARSADWIKLSYESQKPSQTFALQEGEVVSVKPDGRNSKYVAWNSFKGMVLVQLFDMRGCKVFEKNVNASEVAASIEGMVSSSKFTQTSTGVFVMKILSANQKNVLVNRKVMISGR